MLEKDKKKPMYHFPTVFFTFFFQTKYSLYSFVRMSNEQSAQIGACKFKNKQ